MMPERSIFHAMLILLFSVALGDPVSHAADENGSATSIRVRRIGDPVLNRDSRNPATFTIENGADTLADVKIEWSLQLNPNMVEDLPPHPTLGYDHAIGTKTKVMVDGRDAGNSLLTDSNDYTAFETPWGKGYREAIVDIDLGQARSVRGLQWLAADANWIWLTDLSVSLDGANFAPVDQIQRFEMHKKWGLNTFPWAKPIEARHLRFRFYKDQESVNVIRLPSTLMVYDGIENDQVKIPSSGRILASGSFSQQIPAKDKVTAESNRQVSLTPGSYLLAWTETIAGKSRSTWEHVLVKPSEPVKTARTKRFGINASNMRYAESMAECGFGWVRFENGKWQMYCDAPNHFGFDGSIGPWHVNQDEIYQGYLNRGMSVMPYVFQTPEWATSAGPDIKQNRAGYPPKNNADYGEAVFQMVARYGTKQVPADQLRTGDKKTGLNRIQAVELWNEPNLVGPAWAPFVGPLEQYFEVMRAGVDGSRRADPDLPVSSAGWAGTHLQVVEKMAQYKYADGRRPIDLVDIINVHFYSGREHPETCRTDPNLRRKDDVGMDSTFPEQLQELIDWRNRNNAKAQIWLTETGNDVGGPIGLSERQQAAKLPRVMMIALASGIDKVFIYRESGSDPSMHAGAGLLRNDGTMRPSWITTATAIRELQGFDGPAVRLTHSDPNIWLLAWRDDQRIVVSAWTIGKPCPFRKLTDIPLSQDDVLKLVDAFGYTAGEDGINDESEMTLTEFPVYLHVRPGSKSADAIGRLAGKPAAKP